MKYPTKWGDVTLKQYYDLIDALENEAPNEEVKALTILSAVTGISCEDLESKVSAKEIVKALNSLKFINTEVKERPKATIRVKGRRFLFDMVLRDSLAGSFIDISTYTKDAKTAKKNIHNVIAIFAHEVNWFGFRKKRSIKDQQEIAEFFKENLTMDYAFGYSSFFLTSWQRLQKATLIYLEKEKKKILRTLKKELSQTL